MPTSDFRSNRGKSVIFNADDLGRTPGINAGIFRAHREGVVSSATLMVNYPAAVDAVEELRRTPGLGVGLHVALTGGVTTLPPAEVPSLVDAQGRLPAKPEGLQALEPSEVLAEVRAQLRRFHELTGRRPTHLDSHHHSHRHPQVLEALMTVATQESLPVRMSSAAMGKRLRESGLGTTDDFVEGFFGPGATLENLLKILRGLSAGVTEVMCHPAQVDVELLSSSSYAGERDRELAVLTHPEVRLELEALELRLVHFGDLLPLGGSRPFGDSQPFGNHVPFGDPPPATDT